MNLKIQQFGEDYRIKRKKGYNTSYPLTYYQPNSGKDIYREFVESGIRADADSWKVMANRYDVLEQEGFAYEDLDAYH